jgi:hypothetical protein
MTMQRTPLLLSRLVDRGARVAPNEQVVTRLPNGLHRQTLAQTRARAAQLAHALAADGVKLGDRVASLLWNNHRHLEMYQAIPSMGAVLHTLNLRLAVGDRRGNVGVILLKRVNELSLLEIAELVWTKSIERALGRWPGERDCRRLKRLPSFLFHWLWTAYQWLDTRCRLPTLGRLDELRSGAVFVNELSFHGAPPMRCYKPSRFPDESVAVSVTIGPTEEKVVVRHGTPQVAKVALLITRVDHRLADANQLGQFVATLRDYLQHPGVMENVPAARGYTGGFGVDLMLKDLGLATDAAKQAKQPVVLGAVAQQLYQTLSAQGSGGKDFSAIINLFKKVT